MVSLILWLFSGSIDVAERRIRNAWLVGFIWSFLSFLGAVGGIWGLSDDSEVGLSLYVFIVVVLEVGLVSFLSYGVFRKRKFFGLVLFLYFWLSRIFWIILGVIGVFTLAEFLRFFFFHLVPAYFFFQGMRGVWTYYYLTHPDYAGGVDGLGIS